MTFSSIKKYSHDAFSVAAVVVYGAVQLSAIVFSPIYAAPIFVYSAIKTAYYAANFFHFQKFPEKYAPHITSTDYKNKKFEFKKSDLEALECKLKAFEHREKRDLYWTYTKKAAKGLIPVIGYIWLMVGKTPPTSLKPEDTWSDINALKYHIRHLKL